MKQNTKLKKSYKIAIVSMILAMIVVGLSFVFVLLPTYDLVGKNIGNDVASLNQKIDSLVLRSNIFNGATYGFVAMSFCAAAYGVYGDVRKKSEK